MRSFWAGKEMDMRTNWESKTIKTQKNDVLMADCQAAALNTHRDLPCFIVNHTTYPQTGQSGVPTLSVGSHVPGKLLPVPGLRFPRV